jgi:hydrogenase expression/formation protein HypD
MPPAMETIISDGIRLDGFICPGHVAAITGSEYFNFIPETYDLGCVISGFEPADILMSVLMLVRQVNNSLPATEIQYSRAVTREGNKIAQRNLYEVFEKVDTNWRGLGIIPGSGLKLRIEFEKFDAEKMIPVSIGQQKDNPVCICGDILRGVKNPSECSLFNLACFPENPVGACMVSAEGACNSYYKYSINE